MPSDTLLDWAYSAVAGPPPPQPQESAMKAFLSGVPYVPTEYDAYVSRRAYFMEIGDMAIVMILGLLGGIIGAIAYSRSHRDNRD